MPEIVCESTTFGKLPDGQLIMRYTLSNPNGMCISIINYGATLTSVRVPDLKNRMQELTLGFDHLNEYLNHEFYFGATIGRVANRISNAHFKYQKKDYFLSKNKNFSHHLHGGEEGLDKKVWRAEVANLGDQTSVSFFYLSPDGDQGYPGNLDIKVTYTLTLNNELKISFQAETDQATPVDLTNHAYWNLAGAGNGIVLDHIVQIFSDCYVVTDKDLLPTGKIAEVKGTPFDFREPHQIGERIKEIAIGGYDLCYILSSVMKHQSQFVAKIKEPISGRILEVFTTQPGLQFYTSNSLKDYPISSSLHTQRYGAFCMETQTTRHGEHKVRSQGARDRRALTGEAGNASRRQVIVGDAGMNPIRDECASDAGRSRPNNSRVMRTNFGGMTAEIFREHSDSLDFPGAVKYPKFPSPFLLPGDKYQHETIYRLTW